MNEILFIFNGIETIIKCNEKEIMKDIFIKFSSKIETNYSNLEFIYQGNLINQNLTYKEYFNKSNFEKEIKIIVIEKHINNNLSNISNISNDIEIKDCFTLLYKINKNDSKLKIFGVTFVHNNKKICKIIINNKKLDLKEKINIKDYKNQDILKLKLTNVSKITNMSYILFGCSSFLSSPDISNFDSSNITNISYMFSGCSSLSNLPDISKWKTNNINNMSYLFCNCLSLVELPDISN